MSNPFINLEDENTRAAWALLEAMRREMQIKNSDKEGMQRLMRAFAIEICRQQSMNDRIMAGGSTLIKFPNKNFKTKSDYLNSQARDKEWGEDPILYPALEALGYQPVIHLADTGFPPYCPFVQQASDTPVRMDIINYGAQSSGFHWELKGHPNRGGGNCMYYTMADQVEKDLVKVQATLSNELVVETQAVLQASSNEQPVIPLVTPPVKVREHNEVTRETLKYSEADVKSIERLRNNAAKKLEQLSTSDLASLYNKIAHEFDDNYLIGRLDHIAKENGLNPKDPNNFIRKAVEQNFIDPDFNELIREELLHALSVEAGKNPSFYHSIMNSDSHKSLASEKASNYKENSQPSSEETTTDSVSYRN